MLRPGLAPLFEWAFRRFAVVGLVTAADAAWVEHVQAHWGHLVPPSRGFDFVATGCTHKRLHDVLAHYVGADLVLIIDDRPAVWDTTTDVPPSLRVFTPRIRSWRVEMTADRELDSIRGNMDLMLTAIERRRHRLEEAFHHPPASPSPPPGLGWGPALVART
jgi:hypothetical protein